MSSIKLPIITILTPKLAKLEPQTTENEWIQKDNENTKPYS